MYASIVEVSAGMRAATSFVSSPVTWSATALA